MTSQLLLISLLLAVLVSSPCVRGFHLSNLVASSQRQRQNQHLFGIIQEEIEEWEDNNDDSKLFPVAKPSTPAASTPAPASAAANPNNTNLDWDAEWQKVVKNQDQPVARPGSDYYKTEAEIAAIKATNQVSQKVRRVRAEAPVLNFESLKNDPKVLLGILAVFSIGIALISAAGQDTSAYSNDSFI